MSPADNSARSLLATLYTYEFDWSPDSDELAYIAAPPPGENNWWVAKLYIQHLSSDVPTTLLDPVETPGPLHGLQIAVPRWSPDGKQIAFIGGLMSDQGATGGDIYVTAAAGGEPRNVTPNLASTPIWIHWLSDGAIGFTEIVGGETAYSQVSLSCSRFGYTAFSARPKHWRRAVSKAASPLLKGPRKTTIASLSSESRSLSHPQSWSFKPGVESEQDSWKQITHYNDNLKPAWGKAESVTWTSAVQPSPTIPPSSDLKDFNVQGWLLYPANYDPAKKYPLIVYVHGGPSSATLPHWPCVGYGPVPFAALGYFVLMPNPRGSYGQGEAFTQANRKDFGYGDLRDILAGVDAVHQAHTISIPSASASPVGPMADS